MLCNGSHDHQRQVGENAAIFGQDSARNWLFYSWCLWKWLFPLSVAFFGKISRRCSCKSLECWARLRCVRPQSSGCFKRFGLSALYIYISKLIYAGKLLHLFRKLFKKQIFSCIPLRRRFFVRQLGLTRLSGSARGVVVYQYTRKKFAKIPKIHPNIPKIIPRYTLYLKFKESDIPHTRI